MELDELLLQKYRSFILELLDQKDKSIDRHIKTYFDALKIYMEQKNRDRKSRSVDDLKELISFTQ